MCLSCKKSHVFVDRSKCPNYVLAHVENVISDSERMGSCWLAKITFLIERTLVTSD